MGLFKRKTPNPYGKKGNPDHQERVIEETEKLEDADYDVRVEHPILTTGGLKQKRFLDVAGWKDKPAGMGLPDVGVQVVRTNKDGTPVKRERDAKADIEQATDGRVKIIFAKLTNKRKDKS